MEEVKARFYRNQHPEMLSLVAEPSTTNTFDWKNVLHVSVGLGSLILNFVVLDTRLSETKKTID